MYDIYAHMRLKPSNPQARPIPFTRVRGKFHSLREAILINKMTALGPRMGAHSFQLENPEGSLIGTWTSGDHGWTEDLTQLGQELSLAGA
jgi:hypothetical protein